MFIFIIVLSGMIMFMKFVCLFIFSVIVVERMYLVVWLICYKLMNSKVYKVVVLVIWIFFMGNIIFFIYW